jgi:hypothetical protein
MSRFNEAVGKTARVHAPWFSWDGMSCALLHIEPGAVVLLTGSVSNDSDSKGG